MPRTNGVYTLPPVYFAENGTTIMPNQHNVPFHDVAAALTGSLPRDGSASMTGNLPMGGRKITGLANGTAAQDAAAFGQIPVLSAYVKSMSSLSMVADRIIYSLNSTTAAMAVCTAFGRSVLASADSAAGRVALGLGNVNNTSDANKPVSTAQAAAITAAQTAAQNASVPRNGSAAMTGALAMGSNKITGLAAGTAASDAVRRDQVTLANGFLNAAAALTYSANQIPYATGASSAAATSLTATGRSVIGAANAAAARTAVGVTAAQSVVDMFNAGGAYDTAAWVTGTGAAASMPSPAQIATVIKALTSGWSQTWQDMTANRAVGTSYRNTTGKSIQVSIAYGGGSGVHSFQVSADNSNWVTIGVTQDTAAILRGYAEIPHNHYYRITGTGTPTNFTWSELR